MRTTAIAVIVFLAACQAPAEQSSSWILEGNFIVEKNLDLQALEGCVEVTGDLDLGGYTYLEKVWELDVERVGGDLFMSNPSIQLPNLFSVSGSLEVDLQADFSSDVKGVKRIIFYNYEIANLVVQLDSVEYVERISNYGNKRMDFSADSLERVEVVEWPEEDYPEDICRAWDGC